MECWEEQETTAVTYASSSSYTPAEGGRGRGRGSGFKSIASLGTELWDAPEEQQHQQEDADAEEEHGFRGRGRGGRGSGRGFSRSDLSNSNGRENGEEEFGFRNGNRDFRRGFKSGDQWENGGGRGGFCGRDEDLFPSADDGRKKDPDDGERPRVTYIPPELPDDEESIYAHYATGINFNKYDDITVDVDGRNPPPAILTFEETTLCESLRKAISKSGYVKPTPVQKHGIPIISAGRDLMACAQTGSGKTAAFLLPILQQLMADGTAASSLHEKQEPEAVIVAPTRELIRQIYLEARKFSFGTCVRPVVVYGGVNTGYQMRELSRGCNVLCGTPGRLLDMIKRGKVGLSKVRYFVLDEADRMLDMGFEPDMRRIVDLGMPPKEQRQTMMFSATFPEDIRQLARDFLKPDYLFLAVGVVGGACSDVEQTFVQVTKYSKREQLLDLLRSTGTERTVVFVETKRQADFIATFLCQENVPTTSIHGDREQRERENALADFSSGRCPVLVATSVAARGLDIPDVQRVVNFDLPSSIEEYVHRIGRTGRCGNLGRAVSFFDPDANAQLATALVSILTKAQQVAPSWLEDCMDCGSFGHMRSASRKNGFAPSNSRMGAPLDSFQGDSGASQPLTQAADDDFWE